MSFQFRASVNKTRKTVLSGRSCLCRSHQEGFYRCLPVHMQDWCSIKVEPNNWLSIFAKTSIGYPFCAGKTGVYRLRAEISSVTICVWVRKLLEKAYGICVCAFCSLLSPLFRITVQNATWLRCIAVLHSILYFTRFPWDRGCWSGCRFWTWCERDLQEINRNYSTDLINVMEVIMCLIWW